MIRITFFCWLQSRDPGIGGRAFVRRSLYGEYVEFCLREALRAAQPEFRFEPHQATVRKISLLPEQRVSVELNNREVIAADQIVLALASSPPGDPLRPAPRDALGQWYVRDPWSETSIERCAPDEAILFIGTGLTMVDFALILKARRHRAPMYALSRHGLLPHPHRDPPRPPASIDTPFHIDRSAETACGP